jgi:hypothetical protein
MTFDEMVAKVLPIFPAAIFGEDELGEVTISTGFRLVNDNLVSMEEN